MRKKSGRKIFYFFCALTVLAASCIVSIKIIIPKACMSNETTVSTEHTKTSTSKPAQTTASQTKKTTSVITTSSSTSQTLASSTSASSAASTAASTSKPTSTTCAPHIASEFGVLDNCAFVGNSRVLALKNYGLAKNVYGVVGLNVDTVFTKSVSGSNVPVIDELNGKDFEKIFLVFGENECGWPNRDEFIRRYAKVVDAVKERVPNAHIYLQSILPVSQKASETDKYGTTNENINILNVKIKKLAADKGIYYLDAASALKDSNGVLPDEAASDGVHLNKKYCKIWLTYIIETLYGEEYMRE